MSRTIYSREVQQMHKAAQAKRRRLVILTPTLGMGGAERWCVTLARMLREWDVTIGCQWGGALETEAAQCATLLVSGRDGIPAIRAACEAADVVLAWGFVDSFGEFIGNARCVVGVSHAMPWGGDQLHNPANYLASFCHHLAAVCGPAAKAWPSGRPVTVIENGIELDRVCPARGGQHWRNSLGIPQDARVVLVLGRIAWEKRPEVSKAVIEALPNCCHLVFCGADFHKRRGELSAPRVHFAQSPHVGDALDAADVMLLPSVCEAMPLSVLEAMAAGVPVVCTRWPVIVDMEAHHGQLVRSVEDGPDFASRCAAQIVDALAWPSRLRDAARSAVWRDYTAVRMAARWNDYLSTFAIQSNA